VPLAVQPVILPHHHVPIERRVVLVRSPTGHEQLLLARPVNVDSGGGDPVVQPYQGPILTAAIKLGLRLAGAGGEVGRAEEKSCGEPAAG